MNESHIAKNESQAPKPSNIEQAVLQTIVYRSINDTSFEITSWQHQQLFGGMDSGSSIHRFSGEAANLDQVISWSLILKVLHPRPSSIQPSSWNYYKREADAYQSGYLNGLPGGNVAPRSFSVTEYSDGTCWIWLEDVKDEVGERWPLEHYGVFARQIGQFNGAYLTGHPLPDGNWLSSDC